MLGNGSGIQAWYNSLGLVPNAVAGVNQSLGNAMQNIAAQRRQENAEERRRRDIKTAERKQRQGMLTNLGIGVGGAALGAGIGTALAAPAAGAAGGGLSSAAGSEFVGPPSDAMIGNPQYPQFGGDPTGSLGMNATANIPKPNQFGYLGNSRGQVFGNLFLQGLGGVIPGMGGVAAGINSANQMNYQTGRDAVADQFRNQQLGLQREGLGLDREQLAATIDNQQFNQRLGTAKFMSNDEIARMKMQEAIDENARKQNRFDMGQQGLESYRQGMLGIGTERNSIMRERNTLGPGGATDTDFIRNYNFMNQINPELGSSYSEVYSGKKAKPAATSPLRDTKDTMNIIGGVDKLYPTGDPQLDEYLSGVKSNLSGASGSGQPKMSRTQYLTNIMNSPDDTSAQRVFDEGVKAGYLDEEDRKRLFGG